MRRSLITLKALTYRPTGGIVAAPTTSLPEQIGGARNWDYRFCWLRDATFTLLALMNGGYYDEAEAWRDWLLRAVAGSPAQMQIMYGIGGERRLAEFELPWLPGYEGSQAGAHRQRGLDPASARRLWRGDGRAPHRARDRRSLRPTGPAWALQRALLDHLETIWREPDEGIWEVRNGRAAVHLFQGDGLGRLRPRRRRRSRDSGSTVRSSAGARCATRSTTRSAATGSTPRSAPSPRSTAATISMRACC